MKKRKKIIAVGLLLLCIAAGFGFYQYSRQPADIRREPADITVDATQLVQAFNQDEEIANSNYVDKVLLVTGKLKQVDYNSSGQATIQLEADDPLTSVTCNFYKEETAFLKNIAIGSTVQVKGICTGKLVDVVLNKCSMPK